MFYCPSSDMSVLINQYLYWNVFSFTLIVS